MGSGFGNRSRRPQERFDLVQSYILFFKTTLPNGHHPPAGFQQLSYFPTVPFSVSFDLRNPEFGSGCRKTAETATMPVPETTVDKDHGPARRKDQVRSTWKGFDVQPVPITSCMEKPPNEHLRFRVTSFHAGHETTAFFWGQFVGHMVRGISLMLGAVGSAGHSDLPFRKSGRHSSG